MGTRWGTIFVCLFLVTGACGDDGAPGGGEDASTTPDAVVTDATPPADASPPDAMNCPAPAAGDVGGACADDGDCTAANSICVDEGENFPAVGYCVNECMSDTDCATGSSCVDIIEPSPFAALNTAGGGPPDKLCMPNCCANDTCGDGLLCSNVLAVTIPLDKNACLPGDIAATDHDSCDSFGDCNEESFCVTGPDAPGGFCAQFGCIVGDNTTCTIGTNSLCIGEGVGGMGACFKQCTMDSECREAEGYQCLSIGALSICAHATFGNGCGADADCGLSPWTCDTGQPGGYCTIACDPAGANVCGQDAVCIDRTGGDPSDAYCADLCMGSGSQGDCRTGYFCAGGSPGGQGACIPAPMP